MFDINLTLEEHVKKGVILILMPLGFGRAGDAPGCSKVAVWRGNASHKLAKA